MNNFEDSGEMISQKPQDFLPRAAVRIRRKFSVIGVHTAGASGSPPSANHSFTGFFSTFFFRPADFS